MAQKKIDHTNEVTASSSTIRMKLHRVVILKAAVLYIFKLQLILGGTSTGTNQQPLSNSVPVKIDNSLNITRIEPDTRQQSGDPKIDTRHSDMNISQIRHYIFGYGSLICSQSRKITAPTLTKPALPVIVQHLRRTWTARVGLPKNRRPEEVHDLIHGQTAMGIQKSKGYSCTGVLIEVDQQELEHFDKREQGYDRVEIDLNHVFPHDEESDHHHVIRRGILERRRSESKLCPSDDDDDVTKIDTKNDQCTEIFDDADDHFDVNIDAKVWVYLPKGGGDGANRHFPIMQSYVDIILRGCLSFGDEFALNFLESTFGWWHDHSVHGPESEVPDFLWLDDRNDPYYIRADEKWSNEMKHLIDDLIKEVHPEPFEKRRHLDHMQ